MMKGKSTRVTWKLRPSRLNESCLNNKTENNMANLIKYEGYFYCGVLDCGKTTGEIASRWCTYSPLRTGSWVFGKKLNRYFALATLFAIRHETLRLFSISKAKRTTKGRLFAYIDEIKIIVKRAKSRGASTFGKSIGARTLKRTKLILKNK